MMYGKITNEEVAWTTGTACLKTCIQRNSSEAAEDHDAEDKQSNYASQNKMHHFLSSKTEL